MNMHKNLKWTGTINGVAVSLELNNSGELPKMGATGLLESEAEWAVAARAAGIDKVLLEAKKESRSGHGFKTEFKDDAGRPLILANAWGSKDERQGSSGIKYDAILDHIQAALDANPKNKELRELFKEEILALEERRKKAQLKKDAAIATVKALGLTLEDLKALGFN